jgi:endoglycosylceramidase
MQTPRAARQKPHAWNHGWKWLAPLGLVCVLLTGCGSSSSSGTPASPAPARAAMLSYLHVGPASGPAGLHQIVDANGRSVLLRGVNVVGLRDDYSHNTTPFVPPYSIDPATYANGACPPPVDGATQAEICSIDAGQLRSFGYDSVRLPVSWSQLEPQPGTIDNTYIERIAQIVAWFKQAGIYTIIDMHQDDWSKYVFTKPGLPCPPPTSSVTGAAGDGAPQWASIYLTPACTVDGIGELDLAVEESFSRFWLNLPGPDGVGLQDHFAKVVLALAQRFHDEPAVAGYELFNEPLPGLEVVPQLVDLTATFPFYAKVIKTVTGAVPGFGQLFFVEPDALRNVTQMREEFVPWSTYSDYPNVVFAPHVYTGVFTPDAELGGLLPGIDKILGPLFTLSGGYGSAVGDAKALGLPLWVGEFGNGVADDDTLLRGHYQQQDQDVIGSALWTWESLGADNTDGVDFCVVQGPTPSSVVPFPSRVKFTARAYPMFTAGTVQSLSYDPDSAGFDLKANSPVVTQGDNSHATVLYVPAVVTAPIEADGAQMRAVPRGDGSRDVYVYPAGGDYHVYAGAPPAS